MCNSMPNLPLLLAVVIVLVLEAENLTQYSLLFSSELQIRCTIYEGVDRATQIIQEPVCKVRLSRSSVFPTGGVNVIHDADRKPATCKADHYCH